MSRLATVLDLESPPKLESTDCSETETLDSAALMKRKDTRVCMLVLLTTLLFVLISLLCELLLLWRFLPFRNILHHDDRIQPSRPADLDHHRARS